MNVEDGKKKFFNEGRIYVDGKFYHDGKIYPHGDFFKDKDDGKYQSILTEKKVHIGVNKN